MRYWLALTVAMFVGFLAIMGGLVFLLWLAAMAFSLSTGLGYLLLLLYVSGFIAAFAVMDY